MINHLLLVGCGHMGYAMLRRWVDKASAKRLSVISPQLESLNGLEKKGVQYIEFPGGLPENERPDVIVFAVKPQILPDILKEYTRYTDSLFLSIAAGKPLDFYAQHLGGTARIIRAMPNLPAKVGEGATLLARNTFCTRADMGVAETLLSGLGMVSWLEKENLMDVATALSGCGPAYFYYLADAMAKVGTQMGLPEGLAADLARQTCIGAAALWKADGSSAATLYQSIAVKGGMTAPALDALKNNDALIRLMHQAFSAALAQANTIAK